MSKPKVSVMSWDRKYNPTQFPMKINEDGSKEYLTDEVDPSYYLKNLDAIILPNKFIRLFGTYLEQGDISIPFILEGRPGHGKTALVDILIRHIGLGHDDFHILDGSVNGGIDDIRSVQEFVQSAKSGTTKKILFIDEADGMSFQAWNALKKTMKDNNTNCTFCFATNHADAIPEAVRDSRTRVYSLVPRTPKELEHYKRCIQNRLMGIYKDQNVPVENPRELIPKIVNHWFPDIRQLMLASQDGAMQHGQIDENIFDLGDGDINIIVNHIKAHRDKPNDKKILEDMIKVIQGFDPAMFYSEIQDKALRIFKPESYLDVMYYIATWKKARNTNPYLNIFACISDIIRECKFL